MQWPAFSRAHRLRDAREPLRLDELARRTGMSTFHFLRRLETPSGRPPSSRDRVSAARAKTMLVETDRSVTEICFRLRLRELGSFRPSSPRDRLLAAGIPPRRSGLGPWAFPFSNHSFLSACSTDSAADRGIAISRSNRDVPPVR